jgi:NADPH-dependent 2,4-dienoyl-CoA reductase/sulfur reductase-like enzyme
MDTELALAVDNMPGMASPIAPWLKRVGEFRREMKLPVFHAARISDIATARYAIRENLLDMVAMTRAHIADPYIVAKLASGREDQIRPCVGATHCQSPYRPSCLHNPSTGREATLPHVITKSDRPGRKIVVVGGGPAGLEAARVCAERGHSVVLMEAQLALGGQVLLAARESWRKDLIGVIDWRRAQLERLGVQVRLNLLAEAQHVLSEQPDVVIVATGGTPDLEWLDGAEHSTSVWDALSGNARFGSDIIVYDGTGRHPAALTAELAVNAGSHVSLISLDAQLAQELTYAERIIWKKRAYELGFTMIFDHQLERISRQGNGIRATFRNLASGQVLERTADQIIVEHGTVPVDSLYNDLRSQSSNDGVTDLDDLLAVRQQSKDLNERGKFELHRIGDAVASRNIHAAVLDALRLCTPL